MANDRRGKTTVTRPDKNITPIKPTITIYQDPSYIEGILQQRNVGLITDSSDALEIQAKRNVTESTEGGGGFDVNVRLPGVGGVGANASVSGGDERASEDVTGQTRTSSFKYTSAFYLHHVRQSLSSDGLLKTVSSAADVRHLRIGDFVEFQSQFEADKVISLMS